MIILVQMLMYSKEAYMSNFVRQPPRYSAKQGLQLLHKGLIRFHYLLHSLREGNIMEAQYGHKFKFYKNPVTFPFCFATLQTEGPFDAPYYTEGD